MGWDQVGLGELVRGLGLEHPWVDARCFLFYIPQIFLYSFAFSLSHLWVKNPCPVLAGPQLLQFQKAGLVRSKENPHPPCPLT